MIIMMELICAIPENIGWALVGAVAMLDVLMIYSLGRLIVKEIKARKPQKKSVK